MGVELSSLGINLNFAPVLDVDSNPQNPVIGARSFSQEPEAVAARACAFIEQMEAHGVRACGKHFPGHGDTRTDSHYELPVIEASAQVLRNRELKPFAAAIARGIGMIMTSHILFRELDNTFPATLSGRITRGLLREELGFQGVIVSDDVGMQAVSSLFEGRDAAERFLSAGNDMLMICAHWTDTERARVFARSILDAWRSGTLDRQSLERSHERIDIMLNQTAEHAVRELPNHTFRRNAGSGPLFSSETVEIM